MFKEIIPTEIKDNIIDIIKNEWMLITAGDQSGFNMMTASWGFMGEMWNEDSVAVVIRPQRYTMEFVDKSDYFSLSFYRNNKAIHAVCGKKSGRDIDKMRDVPLTPLSLSGDTVAFNESRLVLKCKKICTADMETFDYIDKSILQNYADGDFHKLYICEITEAFIKD